ncbi:MAG TPA: bifunctional (p)ppGpp synthetase/guanosine-3',5'-bis(diphosphate) 3'-pyrophosphohydrolase [Steroidobacteraceae bacterium]|nr:bifunctional (p)ppGpp synthetase/guanosine-3',5'-bis(diphosphate) 3'-pyrophosphohydrolase [Steroidobacteraceae bacterium]
MSYASSILGLLPGGRRAPGIAQLIAKIEGYLPPEQVERVREAFDYAEVAHQGQKRQSGEAYITHPVAVADILADLHLDGPTLTAAILHDVVEDTPSSMAEVEQKFSKEVAEIVDGVTKLDQVQFKSRKEAQAESFRKMILAMVRDIRVIMVKLADRTHNMRTLSAMPPEKRRSVARETLDIYAPIANRLGIHSLKLELEELGFRTLYPQRYRVIERELKRARGNQKEFLPKIVKALRQALANAGVHGTVEAREKHLFSVYMKMRRKHLPLAQVVDVFGVRIVVRTVDECYRTLGLVHGLYRPTPGRFKDYIAIPRVNGYQSLHTTLFGPNGIPLEVQIRTEDMHRMAESGIAAHWQYKTGDADGAVQQARAAEWLKGVMELHEGSAEELVESVKVDLFPDKVYVFTPKGDIMRLPRGATCVDFAYAVHTGVGQRCVAAKVDRRLVPLRTVLRNGQTVEIVTAKGAQPNPAWASFVTTAKARSAIRQYLRTLKRGEAAELGGRMLNQALEEFELSIKKLPEGRLDEVARSLALKDGAELLEKIGLGERLARLIARRLLPADDERPEATAQQPLAIAGTEGLVVSYARCCFPIPYDAVVAYLSSGRGIVIHRENCSNVAAFGKQPDKWIPAVWQKDQQRLFTAGLAVEVTNRMGILAQVATQIAELQSNISHVNVDSTQGDQSTILFEVQVKDRAHLARLIRAIRGMKDVLKVERSLA